MTRVRSKRKAARWTQEQREYLRAVYEAGHPMKQIARSLNRSEYACINMAASMGLHRKPIDKWSIEEDEFLAKNYKTADLLEMAVSLKRTVNALRCRAWLLGVGR